MMAIEVVNNGDGLRQEWPNRDGTGGRVSRKVKGDDPSLSVHRRKVSSQGRPPWQALQGGPATLAYYRWCRRVGIYR
jgi:hypothetical protein